MALQFSVTLRNSRLNLVETTLGASPTLRIMSGAMPANCAAADTGTLLCSMTLPSDWLTAASSGSKSMSGTWSGTAAAGAGAGTDAGYFRLKSGSTTHCQGTISAVGDGGDMTIDNISLVSGQVVNVATFTITDGNA